MCSSSTLGMVRVVESRVEERLVRNREKETKRKT